MPGREHAEKIWANLLELGPRRLMALGVIGLLTLLVVGGGAYFLSQPQLTVLYSGLDRQDVSRIGSALQDAGITYDVSSDGETVLVKHASTGRARMLLAERGLPRSGSSGYELFDDLGSLGLTSFMQEVTKVRAIEGELARTIQSMEGVNAARVHIVLPEKGSFRSTQQPPSASVVLRTESGDNARTAQAVRHLVAASVPGMTADKVTVLNSDGTLLASGADTANASIGQMASMEDVIAARVQQNIRKTLTPYLGMDHFQVSVSAKLNTDKERVAQTIYDPDSRIERSVRVVRQEESSQNASNQTPTTVEQNLPDQDVNANGGERSTEENQRREETINYEISSKTIERASDGYTVDRLSVAVLVDKARLAETLSDPSNAAALAAQANEIEQLVASAAGFDVARGDQIKVSLVDFMASSGGLTPVPQLSIRDMLVRQVGNLVNAAAILVVSVLLIWFGLRPAVNALVPQLKSSEQAEQVETALATGAVEGEAEAFDVAGESANAVLLEDLTRKLSASPVRKLEQVVELNEEQSAAILKQWFYETEKA